MTYYKWREIVKQSAPFLILVSFFSVFSGFLIESSIDLLKSVPLLLFILPAFIGTCGDISSTFAARLTSDLHLGKYSLKRRKEKVIVNAAATVLSALIFFSAISIVAYYLGLYLGLNNPPVERFILGTIFSGVIAVSISIFIAIGVAVLTIKRRLDPDNFESPLLSTLNDLMGVVIFITVFSLIL